MSSRSAAAAAVRSSSSSSARVRRRPVSFGNPALGRYHGFVYTTTEAAAAAAPNGTSHRPLIEGAVEARRLVAVMDVPPEQVPEGILNLARPHRPWINHVRIVIAEPPAGKGQRGGGARGLSVRERTSSREDFVGKEEAASKQPPNATAMESAASILAAERERSVAAVAKHEVPDDGNIAEYTVSDSEIDYINNSSQNHQRPERSYLVLIELCSEDAAAEMVQDLDGQPYTILDETEKCSVHHVVALEGVDGVSLMSPFFAPHTEAGSSGQLEILPSSSTLSETEAAGNSRPVATTTTTATTLTEDYNCAVCLEHMDLDAPRTSVLTTVCNHSFHLDCLLQWQDSPCPVCRYDHSGLNEALSQCHLCGTTENNYVCLICGVVSCGGGGTVTAGSAERRPGGVGDCRSQDAAATAAVDRLQPQRPPSSLSPASHARQHYSDTLHAYALSTETQHVWDFAGNGYVHRLLQNKDDGKLVEVSDPSNTTSQERSLSPGLSEAQEGEVVHRKLEGFASQYYTLLKSQLEQQRIYYEGRLEEIRREYSAQSSDSCRAVSTTADLIAALKQEHHQLSQRLGSVQAKCRKVQEDVAFIKSLNESLEANRAPLRHQVEQAQRDRVEARKMFDDCLPPLQEKVTRLMLQLESSFGSGNNAPAAVGPAACPDSSADSPPQKPVAR